MLRKPGIAYEKDPAVWKAPKKTELGTGTENPDVGVGLATNRRFS